MATTKDSASSAQPPTRKLSARLQRGINLAEERFEEITRIRPYVWQVPSCSGEHTYTVDLKAKTCSCPDRPPAPEKCKHVSAAAYKKARTATCSERVRRACAPPRPGRAPRGQPRQPHLLARRSPLPGVRQRRRRSLLGPWPTSWHSSGQPSTP